MRKRLTWLVAAAVVTLAGGFAVPSARAADANAGKTVYMHRCKMCHAEDGNGNPGMAAALHVKFLPLGSEEVQKMSDADFKKIITEGKDKMKPIKGLSDTEINNVIAFIRTLKKK
jgi:cytochrome c